MAVVVNYNPKEDRYKASLAYLDLLFSHNELEPYLEPTPQEQPLELTLEEIAKKFGVEVSNLKIKK